MGFHDTFSGMSSSVTPTAARQSATTHACVRCSERKVKCDKKHPCTACLRFDFECAYRPLGPRKLKKQSASHRALIQRLKRYESLLQEQGIDVGANVGTSTARGEDALEDGSQSSAVTASHTKIPVPEVVSEPGQVPSSSQPVYDTGNLRYLER